MEGLVSENIEIYNEDCLKVLDYLIEKNKKVDAIITDPPYLINYQSGHRKKELRFKHMKSDTKENEIISIFFEKVKKVLQKNSPLFVFCSWHHIDFFKVEFQKNFKLKSLLVWVKNNHGMGDLMGSYAPKYELVLFGENGRCVRQLGRKRHPDLVFFDKVPPQKLIHPTEKPVPLIEQFLLDYTKEGDIVADFFMGSGSTGEACLLNGRKFLGVEIEKDYFNITKERLRGIKE